MSGLFSKPSAPPAPKIVQQPPDRSTDTVAAAAERERIRAARAKGRKDTILGGSTGDRIGGKTLLGG